MRGVHCPTNWNPDRVPLNNITLANTVSRAHTKPDNPPIDSTYPKSDCNAHTCSHHIANPESDHVAVRKPIRIPNNLPD